MDGALGADVAGRTGNRALRLSGRYARACPGALEELPLALTATGADGQAAYGAPSAILGRCRWPACRRH